LGKSAIYYVAGKLMSGIDTNLCLIDPIQIQWMEGQIGALPVFKTKKMQRNTQKVGK